MNQGKVIRYIFLLVAAIIIGSMTAWFFNHIEQVSEERQTGYSSEARANPFLAAERVIKRLGGEAEALPGYQFWKHFPAPDDVVFGSTFNLPLTQERRRFLHGWIKQGGHLIITATQSVDDEESGAAGGFLNDFGITREWTEDESDGLMTIDFTDSEYSARVAFDEHVYLYPDEEIDADHWVADDVGYRLLQYEIGDGLLTVLSDDGFWRNELIDARDHAFFLYQLSDAVAGRKLWLIHQTTMPGVMSWLWRHAPLVLMSGALLLFFMLWAMGQRLGPWLPAPSLQRRDLGEHLQASAAFMRRWGHGDDLVTGARQRIEAAWLTKHPRLQVLDLLQRYQWLAERSGLSRDEVAAALNDSIGNDQQLMRITRCLHRLRQTV